MAQKRGREGEEASEQELTDKKSKVNDQLSVQTTPKPDKEAMIEYRFLISNYEAGIIIGKGGSNVKVIRCVSPFACPAHDPAHHCVRVASGRRLERF